VSGPRSRDLETLVIKYISLMVSPQQPFLRMCANIRIFIHVHTCMRTYMRTRSPARILLDKPNCLLQPQLLVPCPSSILSLVYLRSSLLIFFPLIYTQVMDQAIQKLYARIRTLNNRLLSCHHVILERRAHTTERQNPRDIINEAGSDLLLLWTMMDSISRCVCVRVYVWGGGYVSVFAFVRVSVHTYMGVSNLLHTHT